MYYSSIIIEKNCMMKGPIRMFCISLIFFCLSTRNPFHAYSFVLKSPIDSVKVLIRHDVHLKNKKHRNPRLFLNREERDRSEEYRKESERLQKLAQSIRNSIPEEKMKKEEKANAISQEIMTSNTNESKTSINTTTDDEKVGYRLYIDIGREPGTWMDPRWGASGKRIEFSMDVYFCKNTSITDKEIQKRMDAAKSNNMGLLPARSDSSKKIKTFALESSKVARLRNGFDQMKCFGGAYRLDDDVGNFGGRIQQSTLRFFIDVKGKSDSSYGDITIPPGCLYFSIPCFGNKLSQLSSKEGIVTIREMGWNTGWRREESRIVGTFRVLPIDQAKRRDKF